jgi:hypothetical protein
VSSTGDYTGLRAYVAPSATDQQRQALRDLGAAEVVERGYPLQLYRYADTSPYWGGSVIDDSQGFYCSTSFTVQDGSGVRSMVTANHCGPNNQWLTPNVVSGGGLVVGTSNGGDVATDSMLISGVSYTGSIYRGPWSSNAGEQVSAAGDAAMGEEVCSGGGMSGEVCGATVVATNIFDPIGSGPGYEAKTPVGTALAGQGDSGSPGFRVDASTNNITILGMLSSTPNDAAVAPCTGGSGNPWNNTNPPRRCFFDIFFVNQAAITSRWGVSVVAGP